MAEEFKKSDFPKAPKGDPGPQGKSAGANAADEILAEKLDQVITQQQQIIEILLVMPAEIGVAVRDELVERRGAGGS